MDNDLISRQAAIDALDNVLVEDESCKVWFKLALQQLPSAERRGRWIMHIDDLFPAESTMECDQCHEEQPLDCDDNYCPHCGARMEVE